MKAAIFNPYLDTLGGGERYTISFAKVLLDLGWQVDLQWNDIGIKNKLEKRFGIDLPSLNMVSDVKRGDGYDLCFWVSDGSIPLLKARKNILHFQIPFKDVYGGSLVNKMKLIRVDEVVCNSHFTKEVVDKEFGIKSRVLYPPVDVDQFKPKRKENIILYVGRFSNLKQSKHQDILIKCFKDLCDQGLKDWVLVLAGGMEVGVGNEISELTEMSKSYPIKILGSPNFKTLKELYGKARVFWSASGFGEDENLNPEKVEHFGITVVEAMAAGSVPIILNAGGHKEIVQEGVNGFLWNKMEELIEKTQTLIQDKSLMVKLSNASRLTSKKYSFETFKNSCDELI